MGELNIITDKKWKNFKYANEVPQKVLENDFDYQEPDEQIDGYFCYRKRWYHIDMFMHCETPGNPFKDKWNGYHGDSFFSGVLLNVSQDGEQYQVATYIA